MTDHSEPNLFDWTPPAPSQRHSPTSIEAAVKIERHMSTLHMRILAYLKGHPDGATDDDLQVVLNMNPSTQRPRRIELLAMGKIRDSGQTRKTRSGRSAVIWVLA
jgi:hypothetical protein